MAFDLTTQIASRCNAMAVPLERLDSIFAIDLPIKLLKIDSEGHEAAVLRGAKRLFERKCIEYLMIEASRETSGRRLWELLEMLHTIEGYGYAAAIVTDDGSLKEVACFERHIPSLGYANLVFYAN